MQPESIDLILFIGLQVWWLIPITRKSNELNKYSFNLQEEREEQIDLLTKSLASSSRIDRWISSFKAVINQFVDIKN